MKAYSGLALLGHALTGHRRWAMAWRNPEPASHYDAVIIGGGGHGLASAYYLAKNHGLNRVAVLEKGWIGGGNTGRNTAVTRSNYLQPASSRFYDFSLRLYDSLSRELNFNIMLSKIGVLTLAHDRHELELMRRRANAMQLHGIDSELFAADAVAETCPRLNMSANARYPIHGGLMQRSGGISRHDAVAWAYARAADRLGVDIIQGCEVSGFDISNNVVRGVVTSKGVIRADKVGIAVAGNSSVVAGLAGVRLPLVSQCLQAMVTEPVKPCLDTVVISMRAHCYVSQSDRGEIVIGGRADAYPSYGQRGNLPATEDGLAATVELFPFLSRLRLMRQWAGIVDVSPDASPIISATGVRGLYLSGGWGTGGYKAIPAGGYTLAHTMATDRPHELNQAFSLDRFASGRLVDETLSASVEH